MAPEKVNHGKINLVRLRKSSFLTKSRLCERTVGFSTETTAAFTLFLYIRHGATL